MNLIQFETGRSHGFVPLRILMGGNNPPTSPVTWSPARQSGLVKLTTYEGMDMHGVASKRAHTVRHNPVVPVADLSSHVRLLGDSDGARWLFPV